MMKRIKVREEVTLHAVFETREKLRDYRELKISPDKIPATAIIEIYKVGS